jgi:HK97 gp10 family phage protein
MPEEVEIQIEGLSELSDKLATLAPAAAKRYLRRCGSKAAEVVLDAMGETVPVGIGILEESLIYKVKFTEADETTMEVKIGPTKKAFWGMFQEFGTRFQAGKHWMGRAWEGCKKQCLQTFVDEGQGILRDLEGK